MIAVEGAPAERRLGEVSGADDESARLSGDVHEDLGAFARLGVFVGEVVLGGGVLDVAQVLLERGVDGCFAHGDTELLAEPFGIVARSRAGARAGHGNGVDAREAEAEAVECLDADEECEC